MFSNKRQAASGREPQKGSITEAIKYTYTGNDMMPNDHAFPSPGGSLLENLRSREIESARLQALQTGRGEKSD